MTGAPLWNRTMLLAPMLGLILASSASAEYRNGIRFDPGREMTARAEGAPAELDRVSGFLGQWDVEIVLHQAEGEEVHATGHAEITFMNRGHALMENFYSESFDGHELAAPHFLGFNPASQRWFLAGADSWDERAWVADGDFESGRLVLSNINRSGGGITLTETRYSLEQPGKDTLRLTIESSTDRGETWKRTWKIAFERKPAKTKTRDTPRDSAIGSITGWMVEPIGSFLCGEGTVGPAT